MQVEREEHCQICFDFMDDPNVSYVDIDLREIMICTKCETCHQVRKVYPVLLTDADLNPVGRDINELRLSKEALGPCSKVLKLGAQDLFICELQPGGSGVMGVKDEMSNAVAFILRRMEWCTGGRHLRCSRMTEQIERDRGLWNPTRLLQLQTSHEGLTVRLVETATMDRVQRYIALSHCWGDGRIAVTTRTNYTQHNRMIAWDALSKTFQDTFKVAHECGLQYIWIDSLCIIQEDREDWAREASLMCKVYQCAEFTIAAAGSTSGDEGLFFGREWSELFPMNKVQGVRSSGPDANSYTKHTTLPFYPSKPDLPLLGRAWAFQERLLSRRILHFTKTELIFECFLDAICECSAQQPFMLKRGFGDSLQQALPHPGDWANIISTYAGTKLSIESDRLTAISGIVAVLPESQQYLAGCFKSHLPRCLMWYIDGTPGRRPSKSALHPSSPPSWSWASVECDDSRLDAYWHNIQGDERVTLLDAKCSLATEDPYGGVLGGYLRLRGSLYTLRCQQQHLTSRDKSYSFFHETDSQTSPIRVPLYSAQDVAWGDLVPKLSADESLYFLPIIDDRGLLLRKNEFDSGEGQFTRIGFAWLKEPGTSVLKANHKEVVIV